MYMIMKHLNYKLMECEEKNYFAAVMKLVDARNNPTGKKLRKDAIELTEFMNLLDDSRNLYSGHIRVGIPLSTAKKRIGKTYP